MTDVNEQVTVTRDDEQSRYEIYIGETLGGYADYRIDSRGRSIFDNTEVDPAFKGRGLGTTLVAEAMADAAQRGDTVVPGCPFVVKFLRTNDVPNLTVDWPKSADAH